MPAHKKRFCISGHDTHKWGRTRAFGCRRCHQDGTIARKIQQVAQAKEILGNRCNCCGETEPKFLTFDHINGGGTKERKPGVDHVNPYRYIISNPKQIKFQLLCYNCNCGQHLAGGICPHKII
jgi:hypothetical protein